MPTATGGSFGTISGTIGNITFVNRKGKQVLYQRRDPDEIRSHPNTPFKNTNTIMGLLMRMYHLLGPTFRKYWGKGYKRDSEHNYFIHQSMGYLYSSIPDKKQLISNSNRIDLSKMFPVYGGKMYEPRLKIEDLSYESGRLHLKWYTGTFREGKPDDTANILALYFAPRAKGTHTLDYLFETGQTKNLTDDGQFKAINSIMVNNMCSDKYELKMFYGKAVRKQGEATIFIDENLDKRFLATFLFFSNGNLYSDVYV
ncbi:MAG: hypothetical protein WC614_08890 [bacterium]